MYILKSADSVKLCVFVDYCISAVYLKFHIIWFLP